MSEAPIAAQATPAGIGAVSIIRTSGDGSVALIAQRFSRPGALERAPGHSLVHGYIMDADRTALDEVLVAVFRAPRSYTGEESTELNLHGSPLVVDRVLAELFDLGFQPAEPGEFTRRAFLNGKLDLTRAEAINELIMAQSVTGSRAAVRRLSGAIGDTVSTVRRTLVHLLAGVAVQLDYGEDEVDAIDVDLQPVDDAICTLRALIETHQSARLYEYGARVVLTGPTNAGKSSLFNRLVGTDRALVSEEPGTTRDYVEAHLEIDGVPIILVDTAGLRDADGAVERAGIARSRDQVRAADLLVEVIDATDPRPHETTGTARIRVCNKRDLVHPQPGEARSASTGAEVMTSARTGDGIGELRGAIRRALVGTEQTGEGPTIASDRQAASLTAAAEALVRLRTEDEAGAPLDILAFELQQAIAALGAVTGEDVRGDLLDVMFASFCVGK